MALVVSLVEAVLALGLWWAFDPSHGGMQFVTQLPWLPQWGISYAVGLDGLSLFMVLLSTSLMPLLVWGSWNQIDFKQRGFYALLLALKDPLHKAAGAISGPEILAILRFAVVALIVLPLLPDRPMGPYGALEPRRIGMVVVLLSGVSLAGYLLVRLVGGRAGWPSTSSP